MKAVILCAGIGSRLAPHTDNLPKCLVDINSKSIIDYSIDNFKACGISDIIMVVGYLKEKIYERYSNDSCISFIDNDEFLSTNNMYSLSLVKDSVIGDTFFIVNGDVIFSRQILESMINQDSNQSLIAVDKSVYYEESMKVKYSQDRLIDISKTIKKDESFGVSIDLYKFSKQAGTKLFKIIDSYIKNKDLNSWIEVAIKDTMSTEKIEPIDIKKNLWIEIDNCDDLSKAKEIF